MNEVRRRARATGLPCLVTAVLFSTAACSGGNNSPDLVAETQTRMDESCRDAEAITDQLLTFMRQTDELELLLRAAREPSSGDAALTDQDAYDKYLEIKTRLGEAERDAPEVFTGKAAWDSDAATNRAKLAGARRNLRALNVDALSKVVGTRRAQIGQQQTRIERCLEAMKNHQRALDGDNVPPRATAPGPSAK